MNTSGAILKTLSERSSLALAILGVILSIALYFVSKDSQIPTWILLFSWIFFAVSTWILIASINSAYSSSPYQSPRVRSIVKDYNDIDYPILLVDPNPLFGNSSLVSIYYRQNDNQFEVLVGHGFVRAVQGNQMLQIKVEEWTSGNDDLISKITSNDASFIVNVVLRPSITRGDGQIRDVNLKLMIISSVRDEVSRIIGQDRNEDTVR